MNKTKNLLLQKNLNSFKVFVMFFFWFLKTTMNYELRNFHLILFLLCLKVEKLTMIFRILSIKITSDESWLLISSKRKSYFLFFRRIISMESEFEIEQNLFFLYSNCWVYCALFTFTDREKFQFQYQTERRKTKETLCCVECHENGIFNWEIAGIWTFNWCFAIFQWNFVSFVFWFWHYTTQMYEYFEDSYIEKVIWK